jgi:hypothetical protein
VANSGKRSVHAFSVELRSKRYLTTMRLGGANDDSTEKILLEGSLGRLSKLGLVEGSMLEIEGSRGTFRLDISEDEMRQLMGRKT